MAWKCVRVVPSKHTLLVEDKIAGNVEISTPRVASRLTRGYGSRAAYCEAVEARSRSEALAPRYASVLPVSHCRALGLDFEWDLLDENSVFGPRARSLTRVGGLLVCRRFRAPGGGDLHLPPVGRLLLPDPYPNLEDESRRGFSMAIGVSIRSAPLPRCRGPPWAAVLGGKPKRPWVSRARFVSWEASAPLLLPSNASVLS